MNNKPLISLNLKDKLNSDEQKELQRRLLALMEQMYLDGISAGRELNREVLYSETEKYINKKLAFLTNYFLDENIWEKNAPVGYDPKKEIPTLEPVCCSTNKTDFDNIQQQIDDDSFESNPNSKLYVDSNIPDWAKEQEVPEWVSEKKPFK